MNTSTYTPDEERGGGGFLNYLPAILWQRRWVVVPPFVLLTAAGIAAAALWPTSYESSATVLVESQELPADLVPSPVTSVLDQRLARIRQQVLSRGDLIGLIEQNGLYEEERRSQPLSLVIEKMREAVTVEPVEASLGQGGGQGSNTIAFTMSYEYRDPVKAQAVMQALVERFLTIDVTQASEQATASVTFLQEQASQLQQQIAGLEAQTTAIKARNGGALATVIPPAANTSSYDAQIASLQSENRTLLAQARRPSTGATRDPLLAQAEAQLAAVRARYTENHPDVARAEAQVAEARRLARANATPTQSDNAIIQSQIAANNATINALTQARAVELGRASASLANQTRAPVVLEQISQLDSRLEGLRERYQEVAGRLASAQNQARITTEQRGERLTVIDPPVVPDDPTSPSPWLLVAAGLLLGLGTGLLLALVLEFLKKPIRGVDQIEAMGLEPLAVVPTFKADMGKAGKARSRPKRAQSPVAAEAA